MSLEERLRQAFSAIEAQVAARIDEAVQLADLQRRQLVAALQPVAVGASSTVPVGAAGPGEDFVRAVLAGDPTAVQQFEMAVLGPPGPRPKPAPQGERSHDIQVTFAHELRRRLAKLRTLSQAIEAGTTRDEEDQFVLMLVRELRDLEQLESVMLGRARRGDLEAVDVLEVTTQAAQTVGWARNSEISVQGSRRALRVRSNPTMLRQALENLIDNAATCGPGHPVEVVVRLAMTRRLPGMEVLVADRGPGLGRANTSRRPGQGVGLPLVRKFAQDNRGRLWCRDRDGGGAVFGLWLPTAG